MTRSRPFFLSSVEMRFFNISIIGYGTDSQISEMSVDTNLNDANADELKEGFFRNKFS